MTVQEKFYYEHKFKEIEDKLEFLGEEIASLQRRIKKMEQLP